MSALDAIGCTFFSLALYCLSIFSLPPLVQDNNLVEHSVMKLVDAVTFQKINALREGNKDESEKIEMEIIYEYEKDESLEGPEKKNVKTLGR